MTIKTSRFGEVDVNESRTVHFPEGLLGFPDRKDFVILDHKPGSPFYWLQSMDTPELAFVITDPFLVKNDYLKNLNLEEHGFLTSDKGSNIIVFTLVTIPRGEVEKMSVNLLGPLVIDAKSRVGKQVIVANSGYNHRHPLITNEGCA